MAAAVAAAADTAFVAAVVVVIEVGAVEPEELVYTLLLLLPPPPPPPPPAIDVFVVDVEDLDVAALAELLSLCIFRALNSSKLRSSGGCIIFDVTPLALVTTCVFAGSVVDVDVVVGGAAALGLFVVGGALMVALLK